MRLKEEKRAIKIVETFIVIGVVNQRKYVFNAYIRNLIVIYVDVACVVNKALKSHSTQKNKIK